LEDHNAIDVDKHIYYDSSMNLRRVFIKNAFGSLKNKWCTLRHYNSRVDKVVIVVACYVLHNYYHLAFNLFLFYGSTIDARVQ